MAQNDVWKGTLIFSNTSTGTTETTGFYMSESNAGPPVAQSLMDIWEDAWTTAWNVDAVDLASVYDDDMELSALQLRRVEPDSPIVTQGVPSTTLAGTETSDNLPPQSALLVSIRTGSVGRRYRGRMYFPPIAESIQTGAGTFSDVTALALAEQIKATFAAVEALTTVDDVGVWSAHAVDDPGPPVVYLPAVFTPFTQIKVDRRLRTQRRRMDRTPLYETA